jgi:metal-responsive CopG/Arc/MetJ family transcriptional regulator
MDQAKGKVSITLSPDVISAVDAAVERRVAASRSAVIEMWLRQAWRGEAERQLRAETIAYYESLSTAERNEEKAIGEASSRAARRLKIDD